MILKLILTTTDQTYMSDIAVNILLITAKFTAKNTTLIKIYTRMAETDSDEGKSDNKHAGEYTEKKRSKTKLVQLATPSVHKFKFIQL